MKKRVGLANKRYKEHTRTIFVRARLTPSESAILDERVEKSGCDSASEYMRLAIFQNKGDVAPAKPEKHPVSLDALQALKEQSDRLNQIAKGLNQGMSVHDAIAAIKRLNELQK